MEVFYPYRKVWTDELDYSVKSLANVPHGKVWVVGDRTEKNKAFTNIEFEGLGGHPARDSLSKLMYAVENLITTKEFIFMNDDFFIMEPIDKITNYIRLLPLDERVERRGEEGSYGMALSNTVKYLKDRGLPLNDYAIHTPMVLETAKVRELAPQIMREINRGNIIQFRSVYGNTYGVEAVKRKDVKDIEDYIGSDLLSSSERTFMGEMGNYIRGHKYDRR